MELPPDAQIGWSRAGQECTAALLGRLPHDEQVRYRAIRHPRTAEHFLLGRIALRTLLAERLGVAPLDVPLCVASDGGVDVDRSAVRVSIAHSGDRAVAIAADRIIGIDLEEIKPRSPQLVDYMLHPLEHGGYESMALDPVRKLILYWTLKESVLKALRSGFRRSPKTIRLVVSLESCGGMAYLDERAPLVCRFEETDGYYCAVAYAR